jgi:acyl-homoserine lactone acylase PvdQ
VRIYAGSYNVSGVSIVGVPLPSLGHSRFCSVAMTTGGPDTSDVYEEEVNPDNPRQYRYDGQWRDMKVRKVEIRVKDGSETATRHYEVEYTHHGPVVARAGQKAYAIKIPYHDQVGLSDQIYEMMQARNLKEMKQALSRLELMAQNVMVGTVEGDIYYLRNGRVPIRAAGVDPSRPVPGNTSATEWRGIHPLEDLVQITNPPTGWMQNCNISPFAMMNESPLVPENYSEHPYLYNAGRTPPHQRAAMMNEVLADAHHVTVNDAIDIAFNTQVWHAEQWQARLRDAWFHAPQEMRSRAASQIFHLIDGWNRKSGADSTGALAYYAFKRALGPEKAQLLEPSPDITNEEIGTALNTAAKWLTDTFGATSVPYGRFFRVGREGTDTTWPVGGGTLRDVGMATPRAIGFSNAQKGKLMIGHSGQTSTQVVILTNPPQSYAVIPLGNSDHKQSGHWDDQAEKLFSKATAAPTYFLNREELLKHVSAKKVLAYDKAG